MFSSIVDSQLCLHKGLFIAVFFYVAIEILEYVLNCREHREQIAANHKRISCCVDCRWIIAYTRMTIAKYTIARVNGP